MNRRDNDCWNGYYDCNRRALPDPGYSFCDIRLPDADPELIAALLLAGMSATLAYACLAFPPCALAAGAGAGVYLLLLILEDNELA